jgi:phosphoglycerate mutase, BPG-dependent, family 1
MDFNDKRHPKNDILYKDIDPQKLPDSESLKNTLERVKPLWNGKIFPQIKEGKNVMIVAHGNSLRAIVKILKNISNKDIIKLNIPTGVPYIFEFDKNIHLKKDYFLGNKKEILNKIEDVSKQGLSER